MNSAWRSRYEVALAAARRAGRLALRAFEAGVAVEWKPDLSPVTAADRAAEALLREALLGAFPEDGFLGEESGDTPGSSGYRWVVDPIDGTRNYARGVPHWATLVGLEYRDEQVAAVVEVPPLGQTFRALRGEGAYRDDQPIRVSSVGQLDQAHLFYANLAWYLQSPVRDGFLDLAARTQRQRGYGDFFGYVLVAQGSGELMLGNTVHPWDVAALKVLVEEAGGRFTAWDGTRTIYRPDVLASNGLLHDTALQVLNQQGGGLRHAGA